MYKYKGYIPTGILGKIGDKVGVSESGQKAVELNAFINVKTAEKKLQFRWQEVYPGHSPG